MAGVPKRKVFNVIVDATALISGVRRNTRDGIKKWVNNGAIRLFVPLHTLQQLTNISTTRSDRFGEDAKETLDWLDNITSDPRIMKNGIVQLQESFEAYNTWAEVEEFLLPKTLLSHESETPVDGNITDAMSKMQLDDGLELASMSSKDSNDLRPTTPSSPESAYSSTSPNVLLSSPLKQVDRNGTTSGRKGAGHKKNASLTNSEVSVQSNTNEPRFPKSLQPFFNHILWRIHHTQATDPDQDLGSYILLTNDALKQSIAHRFGIRVKRIEQLRDIIMREDKDVKNRLAMMKRENENTVAGATQNTNDIRPTSKGGLQRGLPASQHVWDPNTFGRATSPSIGKVQPAPIAPPSGPSGRGSLRGRGGRGALNAPRGSATVQRPIPTGPARLSQPQHDPSKPIDPDSFDRPRPRPGFVRGAGRRKLWEPA
ncbi:hypothetical protein NA57DRAFT_63372 [Rhizodiscina lignyota]|uniref:PIN domain-containing protein n=1 Tax=Rhizodiscina lignyota TaxID=1504668 RepID=A0A9P4IM19_9PEZI|nr:hypothetical protein NA57DRAFT_63372 [Rhizodiscina lignyota]